MNSNIPSRSCSLSIWLKYWLQVYAPLHCSSRKTLERYRQLAGYLTRGTTPELAKAAHTTLTHVNHQLLEAAILSLLTAPAERHPHLSAHTIRHVASVINVALAKATLLDLIPANPMAKVELPSFHRKEPRSLSAEEIRPLFEVCQGDWTYVLVELALATACRRGELLALEWADVNWSHSTLSVSKSIEETNLGMRIKSTKSGRSRIFYLPLRTLETLRRHREAHPQTILIFPDEQGAHRKPVLVSQIIVHRLRKAGLAGATLHSLRHSHASILLSRGIPLSVISARLGHADPNVTARIYCHALPPDDLRAAAAWDDILAEIGQEAGRLAACAHS